MFAAAKDHVTSQVALSYVNKAIARYGQVESLRINSRRSRIELVCRLEGETESIGVTIEKYVIEKEGAKRLFHVLESSATRPWLQTALQDHLHGRKIELPRWAAAAL